MNIRISLFLAATMLLSLTACQSSQTVSSDHSDPIPADSLNVGLVLTGEESNECNQNHISGMNTALETLQLSSTQLKTVTISDPNNSAKEVQTLLDQGCQIIFVADGTLESSLSMTAARNQTVDFCFAGGTSGMEDSLANTHTYFPKLHQARYLSGIAAGQKTKSNYLGFVATKPSPEVISSMTAFYLGAKRVNPEVFMLVSYTGQRSQSAPEAKAAQALIDLGCDVLSYHTDTAATMITAEANGIFAVGYHTDMTNLAPHAALVSSRACWEVYYEYALTCLLEGNPIDQDWCLSYEEGGCTLTPLNDAICPSRTQSSVASAEKDLADGLTHVFDGPLHGITRDGQVLTLEEGAFFLESRTSSTPIFSYLVDGITVLP